MPSRDDVVAAARRWIGTPWRHQGRGRNGIDCLGLVVLVARELGLSDRDGTGYGRRSAGMEIVRPFREEMDRVPLTEVRAGDVVIFADGHYPCHVGIVSERYGALGLVHAHVARRKVIEDAYADEWAARARFAFSFRGVD